MEGISPENLDALDNGYRRTAMIIAAQIFFTIIFTVAVCLLAPAARNPISQQTLTTLWATMIFLALGAFVLRRTFFRWDRFKDITVLKGVSGLLKTLQMNAIVLGALAMTPAIVGGIITVLSGEKFEVIRAGIVSVIVFLINFPRKPVWEKIVAGMEKV